MGHPITPSDLLSYIIKEKLVCIIENPELSKCFKMLNNVMNISGQSLDCLVIITSEPVMEMAEKSSWLALVSDRS